MSVAKTKIAIIQFPGSNCETESIFAVTQAGLQVEEFLCNRPIISLEFIDGIRYRSDDYDSCTDTLWDIS
jgi:CobB/CobQ-like glutamine amidotransferase domain